MLTFRVASSNGELIAEALSGRVVECEEHIQPGEAGYGCLRNIARFDVEEWRDQYPGEAIAGQVIDILDLGYFCKDGAYEEPEWDWRKTLAEMWRDEEHKSPAGGMSPLQASMFPLAL